MRTAIKQKEMYFNTLTKAIIKEVRIILKNHKNLVEYSDVMGSASFTDKYGNEIFLISSKYSKETGWNYKYFPTYKYFSKLIDLYSIEPNFCIGKTIK